MTLSEEPANPSAVQNVLGFDLCKFMNRLRAVADDVAARAEGWPQGMPHGWTLGPALAAPPTDEALLPVMGRVNDIRESNIDLDETALLRLAHLAEFGLRQVQWPVVARCAVALAICRQGPRDHGFDFRGQISRSNRMMLNHAGHLLYRPPEDLWETHFTAEAIHALLEDAYIKYFTFNITMA